LFRRLAKVTLKLGLIALVGYGVALAVQRFTPRAID
jgi:hypothetical protein